MIANACFCVGCAVVTFALRFCLVNENKALTALEGRFASGIPPEKVEVEELDVSNLGAVTAYAPGFRYAL